jgi:hypothetical protein
MIVRIAMFSIMGTALLSSDSAGQEYTKIADAAYCVGVASRNVEFLRKWGPPPLIRTTEQNLERFKAVVEGAFKLKLIDVETANKLVRVGSEDAQLCWDIQDKCSSESTKRLEDKNADLDKNTRIYNNCISQSEAVCKRTEPCN